VNFSIIALSPIFGAMNRIAFFFFFIFTGFIISPTIVSYIDKDVDISLAYTANEEENSVKNNVLSEFTFQDHSNANLESQFLLAKSSIEHYYQMASEIVFIDVTSPPPRHI